MNKKIVISLFSFVILGFFCVNNGAQAASIPILESTPWSHSGDDITGSDFPFYVTGLYNFLLAGVVISALLMVTIGGFMYLLSAGNKSQTETAKKVITDALLGMIIVFITYLILHTINPDILEINSDNITNITNNTSTTTKKDPYCVAETKQCYSSKEECEENKFWSNYTCESIDKTINEDKYYFCTAECICSEFNDKKDCESSNQYMFDDDSKSKGCINGTSAKSQCS